MTPASLFRPSACGRFIVVFAGCEARRPHVLTLEEAERISDQYRRATEEATREAEIVIAAYNAAAHNAIQLAISEALGA